MKAKEVKEIIRRKIFLVFRKIVRPFVGSRFNRFRSVCKIYSFLHSRLHPDTAIVDGNKMFLGDDCLKLSIDGMHERFETSLFKKIVKEGNTVLDIGAHIGYYTLLARNLVGEEGKVFAFEPSPENFNLLKKNIDVNGYGNIITINKAVSNRLGKAQFSPTISTLDYTNNIEEKLITVDTITLDEFFNNYSSKIDVIKMDIEGSEGKAFEGMFNLLEKNKDIIIITEYCPHRLKNLGTKPKNYLDMLEEHGFIIYHINEDEKRLELLNRNSIGNYFRKKPAINLFCFRKGTCDKFLEKILTES